MIHSQVYLRQEHKRPFGDGIGFRSNFSKWFEIKTDLNMQMTVIVKGNWVNNRKNGGLSAL